MDVILAVLLGLLIPPVLFVSIIGLLNLIMALTGFWHDR